MNVRMKALKKNKLNKEMVVGSFAPNLECEPLYAPSSMIARRTLISWAE